MRSRPRYKTACAPGDGIEDEADGKLANLEARHDSPTTNDALASALEAYGDLAGELRESAGPGPVPDAARRTIELRDGLFVLRRRRVRTTGGGAGGTHAVQKEEGDGGGGAHGGVG